MFSAGDVEFSNGIKLNCQTNYPYDMNVIYKAFGNGEIAIHIPSWSKNFTLKINGETAHKDLKNGYLYLDISGEIQIELTLDGTPKFIRATNKIPHLSGMTALMRGPLVYCFEGVDNENSVRDLKISKNAQVFETCDEILGRITKLSIKAKKVQDTQDIYTTDDEILSDFTAIATPYYTWGNRGINQMRVWVNTL